MPARVLVVDDNRLAREQIKEILAASGMEIAGEALDGLEAIHLHQQLKPDLIIMDIVMPNVNGVEATKRILKSDPAARIIICSALGQESLVIEAIDVGAKDYVGKPVKHTDLTLAVKRVLGAFR